MGTCFVFAKDVVWNYGQYGLLGFLLREACKHESFRHPTANSAE